MYIDKPYRVINEFFVRGIKYVVVYMKKAACIMPENDYNRIIREERKARNKATAIPLALDGGLR